MDLGRKIHQLEERIAHADRASRLASASLDNTALEVRDANGGLRAIVGQQGDGTTAVNVVNGPPPPAPSAPIVASVLGGITISWNGTFAGGAVIPLDWSRIEVHASPISGFTPIAATLQSTIETAQGATVVVATTGPLYVRLLARNTSGTASSPTAQVGPLGPTPVVASDVLDGIVTTLKLANGAVTSAKVATGAIDTTALAAAAVTAGKIADDAVTSTAIASGAVTNTEIADGAISTPKLTTNVVTANELNASAVTAGKIATGAVTAGKIAANAVTAGTIAAAAVAAGNLAASSVQAGNLAADSVQAGNVAANAITARELNALAVTAGKIGANAVTATEIAAGSISAVKLAAGSVDATALKADAITGKTITGGVITGATVTGGVIQTASSGQRIVLNPNAVDPENYLKTVPALELHSGSAAQISPGTIHAQVSSDTAAVPYVSLTAPAVDTDDLTSNVITAELRLVAAQDGTRGGSIDLSANNNANFDDHGSAYMYGYTGRSRTETCKLGIFLGNGYDAPGGNGVDLGAFSGTDYEGAKHTSYAGNATDYASAILTPTLWTLSSAARINGTLTSPNGTYSEEGTWTSVTFNQWTQHTGTAYQTLRLSKGAKRARLDGMGQIATTFTSTQTAFTIPSGYRPLKNHYFAIPTASNGNPTMVGCRIGSDGVVTVFTSVSIAVGNYCDFSVCSWPLD
jgi:hypothetical protein